MFLELAELFSLRYRKVLVHGNKIQHTTVKFYLGKFLILLKDNVMKFIQDYQLVYLITKKWNKKVIMYDTLRATKLSVRIRPLELVQF